MRRCNSWNGRAMPWAWMVGLSLAGGIFCQPVSAQLLWGPPDKNAEKVPTVRLKLQPAAVVRPVLKYALLPNYLEKTPGNAAAPYRRALLMNSREGGNFHNQCGEWLTMPREKFPQEEISLKLNSRLLILQELRRATRCESCDWELPLRNNPHVISLTLDELQSLRWMTTLLCVRARLCMLRNQFTDAVDALQQGFVLSRHAAQVPLLVTALVGTGTAKIVMDTQQEMLELPGSPNLYWPLTALPRPLIDFRPALEYERVMGAVMFPVLQEARSAQYSAAKWQELLDDYWERMLELQTLQQLGNSTPPLRGLESKLRLTAMSLKTYPAAKQHLRNKGRSAAEVDQMPVPQVILMYLADTYEEVSQEYAKWGSLPFSETPERRAVDDKVSRELKQRNDLSSPLDTFVGPMTFYLGGALRTDRRIAELRLLEALRHFAATHGNRLPRQLSEIQDVPLPLDPVTGRVFEYRLDGETAIIELCPVFKHEPKSAGKRYELQIAK